MDTKVSYLLTDEGWIEQRPLFLDSEEEVEDSEEEEAKDSDDEEEAKDSEEEVEDSEKEEEEAKDSEEEEAKDSDDEEEAKDSDEETIDSDCELLEDSIVKDMMKAVDSSNLRKPFVHPSKRLTSRSYVRKVMKLNDEHVPIEFESITLDAMNTLTASTILDSMLRSAGVVVEEVEQDYTRAPKKDFSF